MYQLSSAASSSWLSVSPSLCLSAGTVLGRGLACTGKMNVTVVPHPTSVCACDRRVTSSTIGSVTVECVRHLQQSRSCLSPSWRAGAPFWMRATDRTHDRVQYGRNRLLCQSNILYLVKCRGYARVMTNCNSNTNKYTAFDVVLLH